MNSHWSILTAFNAGTINARIMEDEAEYLYKMETASYVVL
jgi:hypothetical protein